MEISTIGGTHGDQKGNWRQATVEPRGEGEEGILARSSLPRGSAGVIGADTEREIVEMALDLVVFRREVVDGLATLAHIELDGCN